MNKKFLLFAYVTLCVMVMIVGLSLGQGAHSNCSKCNYGSQSGQNVNLAATSKQDNFW